jgi:Rps23 Pro-64 3,4-dihydroxylase Tpa1-like proline 4-hydroxylase
MTILDYDYLRTAMAERSEDYQNADPFPHIAVDNFLPASVVDRIHPLFPAPRVRAGQEDRSQDMSDGAPAQFRKRWISREQAVDVAIRRIYWELNSGPFIQILEQMSGIDNLLPDPFLMGGGIHQTEPGGFLRMHADFNRHPKLKLDRRLNLLIYFNRDWPEEYGGHLELWSQDMGRCVKEIAPTAGRCVIFSTTSRSWHGHPRPLACPQGDTRKSLALYYYTHGRPAHESDGEHATLWQKLPGET